MRSLAIILLLLLLAVACDLGTLSVDDGSGSADTSVTEAATVMGRVPRVEERGEVIDGFCPDEVEPVTVRTRHRPEQTDVWELRATAHHGRIVLEWDDPPYQGITGYVVARHSMVPSLDMYGPDWPRMVEGSVRTFTVDDGPGRRQWVDATDIEPSTRYRYRVFPVTHNHFWFPTKPLDISSLPVERPSAPLMVGASFPDGSWNSLADYAMLDQIYGIIRCSNCTLIQVDYLFEGTRAVRMRVLRRQSGHKEWRIVRDNVPLRSGSTTWLDQEAARDKDFDYAICLANRAGIGLATLMSTRRGSDTEVVNVGPPLDVSVSRSGNHATVHWTPSTVHAIKGYHVERQPQNRDDHYNLHFWTGDRAHNYVTVDVSYPDVDQQRFRVRAFTADGPGPWSEWVATDAVHDSVVHERTPKPEIVTLTAAHDQVHLVWRTEDSLDGLDVRYLRRRIGSDLGFSAYCLLSWVGLEEFNWNSRCADRDVGWTDDYNVRPDTEYEYAVQTKRGDDVGPMSDPVSVRTRAIPTHVKRPPLQLHDLEGMPTSDGFLLSWELPEDPTLEGIWVLGHSGQDDVVELVGPVVLPPDQTDYLVLTRGFRPEPYRYWFDLYTFNEYGTQSVAQQRARTSAAELTHCRATREAVIRADIGYHLTIRFRACEETSTQVVRRELTADGLKETALEQPCTWTKSDPSISGWGSDYFEGTLKCEYEDSGVLPGRWYVYELTQTFADGRTSATHHEVVTSPIR